MAKLVVFKFEAADGASQALELVKPLQSQYMLESFDAEVVSWPKGAIKIKNATISGRFCQFIPKTQIPA